MKTVALFLCFCLGLSLLADTSEAEKMIAEAKCMECHNKEDFGDKNSKIKNKKGLHNVVNACQQNNDAMWFDEETSFVVEHLNQHYYKFEEK